MRSGRWDVRGRTYTSWAEWMDVLHHSHREGSKEGRKALSLRREWSLGCALPRALRRGAPSISYLTAIDGGWLDWQVTYCCWSVIKFS